MKGVGGNVHRCEEKASLWHERKEGRSELKNIVQREEWAFCELEFVVEYLGVSWRETTKLCAKK